MDTEMIHKKNGRLHIYVRQDKYKGELKSHNWVGRTYINGKQKISSSGTTNLDEAIPILEKWYDDLHINNEKNNNIPKVGEEISKTDESVPKTDEPIPRVFDSSPKIETSTPTENKSAFKPETQKKQDQTTIIDQEQGYQIAKSSNVASTSMFEKLKNIKFSKPSFGKKDTSSAVSGSTKKNKFTQNIRNFFKSKVSKMSVAGEEIVGIDITPESVRVAQTSKDKNDQWILEKFSYRLLDKAKIGDNLIENKEYLSDEIKLALANAKITSTNVALSIPVTSAIIRVVESPLMSEEELKKAIETDSLWENMDILTDNLNDYSVFHQVINRNSKTNTMDILFVASKLSDVNAFSSIIKKADLNPVIMDVRCFTLKNAFDNISNVQNKTSSAIMEFGMDENYLMIIHNNIPIITDIFLRPQEKQSILKANTSQEGDESQSVIRRYAMQVKQAINEYEGKYETKVNAVNVISGLKNIKNIIPLFMKNLPNTGFKIFDPLSSISIPSYNKEKTNIDNKSIFTSVLGLAFRKLDVFGYYKFVTAVKNINLLPNRDTVRQQNKIKFLSGFAVKGVAGTILGIYVILICLSYFQYNSNKEELLKYDQVQNEFNKFNSNYIKLTKQKNEMQSALRLGKKVSSNQIVSYRALAQITRSVPARVQFSKLEYDGLKNITIQGLAFSDQDILNFIGNLNAKSLIEQASLVSMNVPTTATEKQSSNKKGFTILCKLKKEA
jgi:type IV pilus assembly protein PilN